MDFLRRLIGRDDEITSGIEEPEPRQRPSFEFKPNSQQQVALTFLATLAIGLIGVLVFVPLLRPAPVSETVELRQPDYTVLTAREAYVPAVEAIRARDPGARLASGAGVWYPNIDMVYLSAGRTGWTFHFYLPATSEMAEVVVDRGGVARITSVIPWETPPDLLEDTRWQIDSPVALNTLVTSCADQFRAAPDTQVEARLTVARSAVAPTWQMRARSIGNPLNVCEVSIDAISGVVR